MPGAPACVIEVREQGKRFKRSLLTDDGFDGLNHQTSFAPAGSDWETLRLPLADVRPTFRGRELPGAVALGSERILQIGLMIVRRKGGPFTLNIRRIGLV
jgi:hypothetical protein